MYRAKVFCVTRDGYPGVQELTDGLQWANVAYEQQQKRAAEAGARLLAADAVIQSQQAAAAAAAATTATGGTGRKEKDLIHPMFQSLTLLPERRKTPLLLSSELLRGLKATLDMENDVFVVRRCGVQMKLRLQHY